MTHNHRHEAHYDQLNDARREATAEMPTPLTLPMQAFGPQPIEWTKRPIPVWAWVQFPTGPAQRIACVAQGWNDRVVFVAWEPSAAARAVAVWRQAVNHRSHPTP